MIENFVKLCSYCDLQSFTSIAIQYLNCDSWFIQLIPRLFYKKIVHIAIIIFYNNIKFNRDLGFDNPNEAFKFYPTSISC